MLDQNLLVKFQRHVRVHNGRSASTYTATSVFHVVYCCRTTFVYVFYFRHSCREEMTAYSKCPLPYAMIRPSRSIYLHKYAKGFTSSRM